MTTVNWRGDKVKGKVKLAADKALLRAGEYILEQSNRTIPHETGHMAGTGRATKLSDLAVAISYDTPYALRQHEDTRLRHASGRRAKWLERTLDEERSAVIGYIQKVIKRAL